MILLSDIHLRDETADLVLGTILPGIFDAALHDGGEVGILGDVFHLRYAVQVRLLNALRDEFLRWTAAGLAVRIIPGNHDQIDVQGRNALETLGDIEGVRVYTDPTWDESGLWVPYRKNQEEIAEALRSVAIGVPITPVVFMHHGVRGAYMNNNHRDEDGLPVGMFAGFDMILCGHYHKRQHVGKNLAYIGSPYQTKADEAGQTKGYALWDGAKLTYVDKQWGKRYYNITIADGEDVAQVLEQVLQSAAAADDIRVRVEGANAHARSEVAGELLAKSRVEHHYVQPVVEAMRARLEVNENASIHDYARAFVGQVETSLDKKKLLDVLTEVAQC